MRTTVKRAVVIGTALAVTTGAGVAYAAWVASGTGSAAVSATTAQALSATTVSPSSTLYPGATADAVIQISNPNNYPVHVTSITTPNSPVPGAGGIGTCTTSGVTLTLPAAAVSIDVPAKGTNSITFKDAFAMSNASDNGCQSATFTAPITISGASGTA